MALRPRRGGSRPCRSRTGARGFTLIELMVVVILVAILSVLAIPALSRSRNDQIAFDYARKVQLLFNRARVRANAGSAQLVVGDFNARGKLMLFEAINRNTCTTAGQFAEVGAWTTGVTSTALVELVDGIDLDTTSNIVTSEDIRAALSTGERAFAYCVMPSGRVLLGRGASIAAAVGDMQSLNSQTTWTFTDTLDVRISRGANITVRSVVVSGGSAARILTRQ